MSQHAHGERSHLFTLRVWAEDLGDGSVEWRGKVQHVVSGEQQYFHEWSALIAFLTRTDTADAGISNQADAGLGARGNVTQSAPKGPILPELGLAT